MKAMQILPETGLPQPPDFFINDDYYKYSEEGRAVSEEEYWEKYCIHPDYNYEWNNGCLEVKPRILSPDGIFLWGWFFKLIKNFIENYPDAEILLIKTGFTPFKKEKPVYQMEMGVILNTNPVPIVSDSFSYPGICDMCIEIISCLSSEEIKCYTAGKKKEHEAAGVKEYFILDDKRKDMCFFRLNKLGVYEHIEPFDGDIIRSDVLPGFQFRISDLYTLPPDIEMVKHDVYKPFIMTHYQAEKQRADQEKQKAEQERQRADKFAAKLKELGISVDDV
ncbi:Putative restriction endonuclease type II, DUF820 [Desulfonema limicola]|uniref:Restriction endonuclease type II, DUF820 n=1 Tax=Desulfonema limicola TaxID=45656 RepID=A0A975GET1_9BACT|nr:Uma2 family endonuclease [Desulfonema limicola]QTA78551.1 Putative restriction endonuclease type II, DUF820 [Desulfonema limicola]